MAQQSDLQRVSVSWLKQRCGADGCPRRANEVPFERTAPIVLGSLRAEALEATRKALAPTGEAFDLAYGKLSPIDVAMVPLADMVASRAALEAAVDDPRVFPPAGTILSVEADRMPELFVAKGYGGRDVGEIDIGSFVLRFAFDMEYVEVQGDEAVLVVHDDKGRQGTEDHRVQAVCYAGAALLMRPEFDRVILEFTYILSGCATERLEFTRADQDRVLQEIVTWYDEAVRDPKREHVNRYCGTCPLRGECGAYQAARAVEPSTDAVVPTRPGQEAVRVADLMDERLAALLTWTRQRAVLWRDFVNEVEGEATKRIKANGPISSNGQGWQLRERRGAYLDENEDAILSLLADHGVSRELVTGVVGSKVTAAGKRIAANLFKEKRRAFLDELRRVRGQRTSLVLVPVGAPKELEGA